MIMSDQRYLSLPFKIMSCSTVKPGLKDPLCVLWEYVIGKFSRRRQGGLIRKKECNKK